MYCTCTMTMYMYNILYTTVPKNFKSWYKYIYTYSTHCTHVANSVTFTMQPTTHPNTHNDDNSDHVLLTHEISSCMGYLSVTVAEVFDYMIESSSRKHQKSLLGKFVLPQRNITNHIKGRVPVLSSSHHNKEKYNIIGRCIQSDMHIIYTIYMYNISCSTVVLRI